MFYSDYILTVLLCSTFTRHSQFHRLSTSELLPPVKRLVWENRVVPNLDSALKSVFPSQTAFLHQRHKFSLFLTFIGGWNKLMLIVRRLLSGFLLKTLQPEGKKEKRKRQEIPERGETKQLVEKCQTTKHGSDRPNFR